MLWLDAGCFIKSKLNYEYSQIINNKIWSISSDTTIKRYTHIDLLDLFDSSLDIYNRTMCAGGVIGLYYPSLFVDYIMNLWKACALIKKCIAPNGSNLHNHRQDQSVLSILFYQHHLSCDKVKGMNFFTHYDNNYYKIYNDTLYIKYISFIKK